MRVLDAAVVIFTTAVSYEVDLGSWDLHEVCDLDAEVNTHLRTSDRQALTEVLSEVLDPGVMVDPRPHLGWSQGDDASTLVGSPAVRYNCHLLAGEHIWDPDQRVGEQAHSQRCRVLLPYTYGWELDPDAPVDRILERIEPLDLALAQRTVLGSAAGDAMDVLEELGTANPASVRVDELRRQLDRVRVSYHRLDAYRYDSSQRARALYLSAREEMGLDEIYQRTESVLEQAASSLQAAATERTNALDGRLNRLAAVFTVVATGAFVLQSVEFIAGGGELSASERWATLATVVLSSVLGLLVLWVLSRRRR